MSIVGVALLATFAPITPRMFSATCLLVGFLVVARGGSPGQRKQLFEVLCRTLGDIAVGPPRRKREKP